MESVSKNRENTMNSLKEKNMSDSLLKVDHVTISYNGEPTVQDVSFELKQGEILGIVGESGSGKSTIIKAVMGLLGEEGLVTKGDIEKRNPDTCRGDYEENRYG